MYGCYSSSARGKLNREKRYQLLVSNNFQPIEHEPEKRPASASFARCMKRVFEIDPLKCRKCGEKMKIIAFIFSSREIEKIAENLKLPTWRAPPEFVPDGHRIDTGAEFVQE
jgi:hypothetical protein